jgi:hypothetical protein
LLAAGAHAGVCAIETLLLAFLDSSLDTGASCVTLTEGGNDMFDIGTGYNFTLIEGTSDGWNEVRFTERVTDIDGPLLKFESGRIINAHSSLFVSAVPVTMLASASPAETADAGTTV